MTTQNITRSSRTRRRLVVDAPAEPVVQPVAPAQTPQETEEMRELARDFFIANKLKNSAARTADRALADLNRAMAVEGVRTFQTEVTLEGVTSRIEARIAPTSSEVIDITTLRGLVDDATFLRIVSATKKAVTDHAGTNVLVQTLKTVEGKEALKVTEVRS